MLTLDRLKEVVDYIDQAFYWKLVTSNRVKVGDRAGNQSPNGYRRINIDGRSYLEHHLVFLYHHGRLPKELDHINGIRNDNRIENLRECTRRQNLANRYYKNIGTGLRGVQKCGRKWEARIRAGDGVILRLGIFDTPEQAKEAYDEIASEMYGEFYGSRGAGSF